MSTFGKKLDKISLLDFDDLIIFTLLHEGCSYIYISKFLMLTPPAISHRLLKYIEIFGNEIYDREGTKKVLSVIGLEIAKRAKKALCILTEQEDDFLFKDSKTILLAS